MSKFAALLTLLVAVLAYGLLAAPAQAQRARVFVASYGSDSNPCTFGSPCKTFQRAVDVVAQGGEVTAIDSAGFGPIMINKAVTITSPNGVEAGIVPVEDGDAIVINAGSTDRIILRGLTLNGSLVPDATGIIFHSGGSLNVQNCVIANFASTAMLFEPNTSSEISVSNTEVSGSNFGIAIEPAGTGTTAGVLNHVDVENNTHDGITVSTSSQTINVMITESISAQNGGDGLKVTSANSNALRTNVYVRNSSFFNNGHDGLELTNPYAYVTLTRSMIFGTGTAYEAYSGGLYSYGDNNVSFDDEPDPNSMAYR